MIKNISSNLFRKLASLNKEISEVYSNLHLVGENPSSYISEILKKQDERFEVLFDATAIGIFYFTKDLIITKANRYFSDLIQLEKEEIIGLDLNLASDKKISRLLKSVTRGEEVSFDGFYDLGISNNEKTHITFYAYPIKISDTDVSFEGIGFLEDHTLQRKTERLLQEKEKNYQLLFNHSPAGIMLKNEDGIIIEINQTYAHLLDYEPEQLTGKSVLSIISESDYNLINDNLKKIKSLKQINYQAKNIKQDGSSMFFDIQEIVVPLEGKKTGILVMANDITEKKKLEQDLIKTQELYQIATDAAQIGIWDIDRIGNKLFLNDTILEMLDYKRSDLFGTIDDLKLLMHPDEQKRIFEDKGLYIDSDSLELNIEIQMLTKKGEIRWFLNRGKLYCDNSGYVYRVLGTSIDITDIKNTQQSLEIARKKAEESEKLKSSFLSNISHEIKTPLSGILGFVDLLKEDITSEEKEEFIEIIKKSAIGLHTIIDGIIDLSRIESGELEIKETECTLNILLRDLHSSFLDTLKLEAKQCIDLKGFTISDKNISSLIIVDQNKLNQILNCLITNAIKFTNKGFIEVGCNLSDNKEDLIFYVKDTGIGIAAEFHDQIFIRFRQVDEEHTRQYGGAGLGLAVSKALIERMNGKIWIESEVNQGTTFFFTIPYNPVLFKSRRSFVQQNNNIYNFGNKIILVIEDNDINFSMIKYVLKHHQATVVRAIDTQSAIRICLSRTMISLVLIDSMLPNLDCAEIANQIRQIIPDVPFIVQTSDCNSFKNEAPFKFFTHDCISKPINKDLLLAKIKRLI